MHTIMKAILQVGIFMICAQVLVHFRPNGSYEKYMKLLVSVMMLAQIFFPVVNLFIGNEYNMEEKVQWFEEELEKSMQEAQSTARQTGEILSRMTMEELKERIIEQQSESEKFQAEPETVQGEEQTSGPQMKREDIQIDRIEIDIGVTER